MRTLNGPAAAIIGQLLFLLGHGQQVPWLGQILGGNGSDYGSWATSVVLDENGSRYVYGNAYGQANYDFDLRPDEYDPGTAGVYHNVFLAKYGPEHEVIWAGFIGSSQFINAMELGADGSGGVYTTGFFRNYFGTTPVGGVNTGMNGAPNVIGFMNTAGSLPTMFVTRVDSDGQGLWGFRIGTGSRIALGLEDTYNTGSSALAVRGDDRPQVVGYFEDTVDFDPGPGVQLRGSPDGSALFMLTVNPDGTYHRVDVLSPASTTSILRGAVVDEENNLYVTGNGASGMDMDPGAGVVPLPPGASGFVASYTASGALRWVKSNQGGTSTGMVSAYRDGVIACAGQYFGTVDFDPTGSTDNRQSQTPLGEPYVQYFTSDGGYLGTDVIACSEQGLPTAISFTESGGLLLSGAVHPHGTADLDPSPASMITEVFWPTQGFLVALGADRSFQWAHGIGCSQLHLPVTDLSYRAGELVLVGGWQHDLEVEHYPGAVSLVSTSSSPWNNHNALVLEYGPEFLLDVAAQQRPPANAPFIWVGSSLVRTHAEDGVTDWRVMDVLGRTIIDRGSTGNDRDIALPATAGPVILYDWIDRSGRRTGKLVRSE